MKKEYTFIDIFSGCGGLSYGLEQAGMKCLLGIDHNYDAIETFKLNHKYAETYCGDVRELDNKQVDKLIDYTEVDFVVGGPPCQGFSTVGKGKADDPRNFLFLEFVRIVKHLNPKGIVIENVTGLLANKNKDVLEKIFSIFEEIGYKLQARVLSSDEYGVPEKRRRTIIIGLKEEYTHLFPIVTHGERGKKPTRTVKDAFSTIKENATYNDPKTAQVKNDLDRERLKHIPEGRGIRYERDQIELLPKNLYYDVDWNELREGRFRQTKLQRLSFNSPSFTILTSRTMYFHPVENRYLTAREAASIQSFPSSFEFFGSTTSVFKQIGNAVPVLMAKAIGEVLIDSIEGKVVDIQTVQDFKKNAFHYNKEVAV
ncbi:DNA cytosine methyltransferase [Halobacteriovorax vibrionivorans]|uniref:Cytosine-specific methyltransferase n=1 Tax=Halobacteriovorax vibrionivorans TaxID=2152716 RepID=A0ABY0IFH7_9BACT|nr:MULTISPECIES: DNA cytosine methyltransferase [Halobacteriovorax]RZF21707.1 DNA cytosine methyltransferase [Halobacteriovorax vibrionivorans]TGD46170.1 DNA cytosine methyltransferase [Halobacteriovorax sp. Y22]